MRVDGTTISEMFAILRDKIVVTGTPPKYIEFFDVSSVSLCQIPFDDVIEDTSIPGEFYFEDAFGSRVIRAIVDTAGVPTTFKIYETGPSEVISGDVSLLNGGGDITFNSLDWTAGQVAIISSLKIYFPTES